MPVTVVFGGIAAFAVAFLAKFLVALCKERQLIKVCMLLRQDPEDVSTPESWGDGVLDPLMRRSNVMVMSRKYRAVSAHRLRKPQPQLKVG